MSGSKAFLLGICVGVCAISGADQAVVVGIQEYSPLAAASTLKGCDNDATSIAAALKKDGFTITLLLDSKATRGGIFGEFKKLESSCKPSERFVFYYAGHGRKAPRYALMPSDATYAGNDISTKELNEAILKIPARSRTVILDSCFSGGMAAGEMSRGLGDEFSGRFFDADSERSVKFGVAPDKASQKDTPATLDANTGICYYTAAMSSEQALEATMPDGTRHGLFTFALLNNLDQGKLWGEIHGGVKKTIGQRLENSGRTQNPMISTQFIGDEALDNAPKPGMTLPPVKTLLDVWNDDNPNPANIKLQLAPDRDVLEAGRLLHLDVQIGQDGYLVIFGQVADHFYQFYPKGSTAVAVKKGTLPFPDDPQSKLYFDEFGSDHVKAMLFPDAAAAQSVLDAMQASQGKSKDLILARAIASPAFTSRLSVSVGDNLVGGLRLKDTVGLYKKVMAQDTPVSRYLVSKMRNAGAGYEKGLTWIGAVDAGHEPSLDDKEAFLTLLNLAVQDSALYDDQAFKQAKLPDNLKKLARKPPTGEKLMALNRSILAALFPQEVNADDARGN